MNSNSEWLYLISSNASEEYILDVLETLALPHGSVQHFRYQARWLNHALRTRLPKKGQALEQQLEDTKVVVCYLYQEKRDNKWQWISLTPIRIGTLKAAYLTGDSDKDVAHFYFAVEQYVIPGSEELKRSIMQAAQGKSGNNYYGFLGQSFNTSNIAPREASKSAFHRICDSLNLEQFTSPDKQTKYFPVFCHVDGVIDSKNTILTAKFDRPSRKTFYELREGSRYTFQFSTYFPEQPPNFSVKLLSDEKVFSTPSEYELKVASRYDEEAWTLISALLERDVWTDISIKTELAAATDDRKPLNTHISFPVAVKRRVLYRLIDAGSDVGFGIGTGAIALSKILETWTWWYWPVILGYATWAICKVIIKVWRG